MTTRIGIGWRPEIDLAVERLPGVEFVEVIAEQIRPDRLPESLRVLRARGIPVVPHGVSLSLGGAQAPEPDRLARLAACARALDAPLVSEHIAFVRSHGRDVGHLLPVPRTRASLDVVVANVRIAQDALGVPLALEHIASVLSWPEDELTEARFVAEVIERTGALLLLDVANLYSSAVNFGADPMAALDSLPLDRIAYVHVAGGTLRDGVWHDTHTHPVGEPVFGLLAEVARRVELPAVLLERDGHYPPAAELAGELAAIRAAAGRDPATSPGPIDLPPASPGISEPVVPQETRDTLAAAQHRLAEALVGLTEPPPGFDAERVGVARAVLTSKRAGAVARHAPSPPLRNSMRWLRSRRWCG
ncbi:MAG TPA: DUF692 domain-containing protein [Actinophytocola sp.]|uniref:DUF692 domain-containing protein n=1 Tax=Actinophytocola sp. TaxID=1872138 RepID=UPI002DB8211B|nr:DUF692 domain-containing protein [Actinophytocola sp.]HEU5472600.1 DUF692 domain-containing protein [Actinophytocola sp.]